MRTRSVTAVLVAGLLATSTAQSPKARDEAWREDFAFLAREFPTRQLDFATLYPRVDKELAAINSAIPTAPNADLVLALMRLVAGAHVGHTYLRWPSAARSPFIVCRSDCSGMPTDSR